MKENDDNYCYYSDLPSPMSYMPVEEEIKPEPAGLSQQDIDRVIEMAWEDRTPFEAILFQFGLSEPQVKALMRQQLKPGSYRMWRKRATGCKTKHQSRRQPEVDRFKCSRQRTITQNKISKR